MNINVADLKKQIQCNKQRLIDDFIQSQQSYAFFYAYSQLLSQTLADLWTKFNFPDSFCLLAIGGFGRREYYPFSDLDIAIISQDNLSSTEEELLTEFIQLLWDCELNPAAKIGSFTQLAAAALEDITSDTAFLEARFICGNQQLAQRFNQKLFLQRDLVSFIEGKLLEHEQRHAKSQGSANLLEPNLKTCPGGLRDIHTMMWLVRAQQLKFEMHELINQKIITRNEAVLIIRSHQELASARILLHVCANRAEDRLLFDYQVKVAELLGYQSANPQGKIEILMKNIYRATKIVKQLDGILLPMLKGRVYSSVASQYFSLDENYFQLENVIAVQDKSLFRRDETHIFKIIELMQSKQDIDTIAPKTLRAWWTASQKIGRKFRNNPINQQRFINFFRHGTGLTRTLRLLNLYGVLGKYLPDFDKIVGLLQHDLFHIYPVDDHILTVVRNVRRIAIEEHKYELPLASSLMEQFAEKHIIYLAALLHDIGKGQDGDHAILGAKIAQEFALQHALSTEESDLLVWLVRHHLVLSHTAQKEDINDQAVMAKFCELVNTPKKLIALYILTVADIRGTNPKIWNSWKAGLFENLFHHAFAYLQGELEDSSTLITRRKKQASELLNNLNISASQQKYIWQCLGNGYFMRFNEDEILWHLNKLTTEIEKSCFHFAHFATKLEVMVFTPNAPRLFAQICQIFSQLGLDIVNAKAYVTAHNYILDHFVLTFPENFLDKDKERIINKLMKSLTEFLQFPQKHYDIPPPELSKNRRSRHIPIVPNVSLIEEEEHLGYYILRIISVDKRGLLANIAQVLSDFNISIHHAQISTLDERIEDSFYVYSPKLANTKEQLYLKNALMEKLR